MIVASVGEKPKLRTVRTAREEETLEPGYYVVTQTVVGPESLLTNRTWCTERISQLAWKTLEKLQESDPTAVTWWKFHYGEVAITKRAESDQLEADISIVFEVQETKHAAVGLITVAKIIAVIAALVLALFAVIKIVRTVVYVAEPLVEGARETSEVLARLMPIVVPAVLCALAIGLVVGRE